MNTLNEAEATRLPIPPKFPMEAWYMISQCNLTSAQMKELTMRYITHLRAIAQAEVDLYNDYLLVLDRLESKV